MLRMVLAAVLVALFGLAGGTARAAAAEECPNGWMMSIDNYNFEKPPNGTRIPGWCAEGPMTAGVDRGTGWSRTGANNAFLQTATPQWNAMKQYMFLPRDPNLCFELLGWVRTIGDVRYGYFGVRPGRTGTVLRETPFSASTGVYRQLSLKFRGGSLGEVTIFAGYWSPSGFTCLMVDDLQLIPRYAPEPAPC